MAKYAEGIQSSKSKTREYVDLVLACLKDRIKVHNFELLTDVLTILVSLVGESQRVCSLQTLLLLTYLHVSDFHLRAQV